MSELSKTLIILGFVLLLAGIAVGFLGKIPGIGRLPGDIYVRRENVTFYFPLVSCLILSLVLTLLFTIFGKK